MTNQPKLPEEIMQEFRELIDAWVKRLVKLGQIKDYEDAKGGWTVFQCLEAEQFLAEQLAKERGKIFNEIDFLIEDTWKEDLEVSGGHKLSTQRLIDRIEKFKQTYLKPKNP